MKTTEQSTQYTFSDVLIQPKYSEIKSREEVSLSSNFGMFNLDPPVISANMKTITGPSMAVSMCNEGGMGILHRFDSLKEAVAAYYETKGHFPVGVSIGVHESDFHRAVALFEAGARIFCIDVAHGHHLLVKNMIQSLRTRFGSSVYIIAGNIATKEATLYLASWKVDAVKVGVGPGSVCRTRQNTGVGVSQLHALKECYEAVATMRDPVRIIADGGITCIGDISKSLVYADAVMVGFLLSGTTETPGSVFKDENGGYYKVYSGSSSAEQKEQNGQPVTHIEGITTQVRFRGSVKYILKEIREGIQSAFSYTGARNLDEFQQKVTFGVITEGGRKESKF